MLFRSTRAAFIHDVVNPTPFLNSIVPDNGIPGSTLTLTISGANFITGATFVTISGTGVNITGINVLPFSGDSKFDGKYDANVSNGTRLDVSLTIDPSAALGARYLSITTPYGTTTGIPFAVRALGDTGVTAVPRGGVVGSTVSTTITGSGFIAGQTVLTDRKSTRLNSSH